jgi:hypothetical protein
MQIPLLATHALQLRYTGSDATHTVAVDADGGTTAGLLTLTDVTTGATALDLGLAANDTIAELVAVINAVSGWESRAFRAFPYGPILSTASLLTADTFADLAAQTVTAHWENVLAYSADTVTIAAGGTNVAVPRALPLDVALLRFGHFRLSSVLSGAGADLVTFNIYGADITGDAGDVISDIADADWTTTAIANGALAVTSSGATAVIDSFNMDLAGLEAIKLGSVTNASGGETATIKGWLSFDDYRA